MLRALDNLRVLDFSRVLAGPMATMLLADLGATVVKVERPRTGDDTRMWGPPYDDAGEATYYQSVNRGKRGVTADLNDPEAIAALSDAILTADVLVENFRPGVMDRLGLGYDRARELNPALIYCSITGFGRDAGSQLPGYDLLIQALGGLMSITGEREGEPQKVGVALVDVLTGLFATVGILAALRHRQRCGRGQRVDVDLLSSLLASLANQGSAFTLAGVVGERMGNAHPSIAPYELISTDAGDVVLAVGTDEQFAALCEVLGDPRLSDDPRFATNAARVAHRTEMRERLQSLLADNCQARWIEQLTAVGVPAGQVNDIAGAFALAHDLGLEPTVDVPRPDGTTARLTRNPIRLSETPAAYRSAPPRMDELGALDPRTIWR